jgi:lysophospholipase L1-like esterase
MGVTFFVPTIPSPQYCYLPSQWDTAWKNAKATIANQKVSVVGIGDSITAGQGSTNILSASWWALLRSAILAANSNLLGGDHYGMIYGPASIGYNPAGSPLTVNGVKGTNYDWNYNAFNSSVSNTTAQTPFISVTPSYAVIGFDVLYLDLSPGSPAWTYNIDGGSNTNVVCSGDGTAANSQIKKVSITGLAAGTHTLNINAFSSGYRCNIVGVTAYAATSGLCFANMGSSGMGLVNGYTSSQNNLTDTTGYPPDRLALYQGYTGTTASPSALSGLGFPTQPDLAIIAFGVNDAYNGTTLTQMRDSIARLVWSLRYGKSDACSIVIVAMFAPDGTASTSTSVAKNDYGSGATAYRDLRAAMLQVAQAEMCAFVDVHGLFGRFVVTNGWITSTSDLHPAPAGHLKIANLLGTIV